MVRLRGVKSVYERSLRLAGVEHLCTRHTYKYVYIYIYEAINVYSSSRLLCL